MTPGMIPAPMVFRDECVNTSPLDTTSNGREPIHKPKEYKQDYAQVP